MRKVVQISAVTPNIESSGGVWALCDDGTVWYGNFGQNWEQLNYSIPGTTTIEGKVYNGDDEAGIR